MMLHIPEFRAAAVCNQHLDHEAFDVDLGPDVVKVVRCRDCKHGDRVYEDRDDYGCRMMLALPRWFKGDHFCAYGERKDGGG